MTDYLTGFGNSFATEAVPGALPVGRNSPQKPAFGLYAEQLSGTAFTAPRHENRRSWLYRLRPSASHAAFAPYASAFDAPPRSEPLAPNRLRWSKAKRESGADFVDGLAPMLGNGAPDRLEGCPVHLYAADRDMERRVLFDADGELLLIPQEGRLELLTELGRLEVAPGSIALIPRGVRFGLCRGELRCPVSPPGAWSDRRERPRQRARFRDAGGLVRRPRRAFRACPEIWWSAVAHDARSQPARCRRVARQPRPVPLRPRSLQHHRHGQLRPS
jgi:hypothetical protein